MPLFTTALFHPERAAVVMSNQGPHSSRFRIIKELLAVILLMVVLAGLLSTADNTNYLFELRYCLAIGISIQLVSHLFMAWFRTDKVDWRTIAGAIIVGTGVGIVIGTLANGMNPLLLLEKYPNLLLSLLVVSMICGPAISYFFYSRAVISETKVALRQEELERISYQQRLTEANFRVLQAQIEPHFLFNTLSNILSLIRTKPDKAEQMLTNFTEYLRSSLQQTRTDRIELRDELTTIRAYLDIMTVRMENRLRYSIDVQPALLGVMIPPLLLQPLVENAVQHGIEPKPDGGVICLHAKQDGDMLILAISDTGVGISPSNSAGVGMANIRDRLHLMYHERARFQVMLNTPQGTIVRLTIPLDSGEDHE